MTAKTSRYRPLRGAEGEAQPGSRGRVPRNLLGLTTKRELDRAEAAALALAQETLYARLTPDTQLTALLLKEMHREWLGEIYEWAGEYRQVELEKNGFRWPPAERVAENMETLEREVLLRFTPCRPAPLLQVAHALAVVHAELLLVHPFRDGNGRLARWVADTMATQAGRPAPAYGFVGRGSVRRREEYLVAVQDGYLQNYSPLSRFFETTIRRREGGEERAAPAGAGFWRPEAPSNTDDS